MTNIAVLGAGAWGTTLAKLLCENDHKVKLWSHSEKTAYDIRHMLRNKRHLDNIDLPEELYVSAKISDIIDDVRIIVNAVASPYVAEVFGEVNKHISGDISIVSATKGLNPKDGSRMSEIIKKELGLDDRKIAVMSGPSLSKDIACKNPVVTTIASHPITFAEELQKIFCSRYFRPYICDDVIGVELSGAVKNVLAIAAGICRGAGYGDSSVASVVGRGWHDLTHMAIKLGVHPTTFWTSAVFSDVLLSCTTKKSRNHMYGVLIGSGAGTPDTAMNYFGSSVIEGRNTVRGLNELINKLREKDNSIFLPVFNMIYGILEDGLDSKSALDDFMSKLTGREIDAWLYNCFGGQM